MNKKWGGEGGESAELKRNPTGVAEKEEEPRQGRQEAERQKTGRA